MYTYMDVYVYIITYMYVCMYMYVPSVYISEGTSSVCYLLLPLGSCMFCLPVDIIELKVSIFHREHRTVVEPQIIRFPECVP